MNSEIPPIPESDNNNQSDNTDINSVELADEPLLDESEVESTTSEDNSDASSEQDVIEVDVTLDTQPLAENVEDESELESADSDSTEFSSLEVPELSESAETEVLLEFSSEADLEVEENLPLEDSTSEPVETEVLLDFSSEADLEVEEENVPPENSTTEPVEIENLLGISNEADLEVEENLPPENSTTEAVETEVLLDFTSEADLEVEENLPPENSTSEPVETEVLLDFTSEADLEVEENLPPEDSTSEPELFVDSWLDESKPDVPLANIPHTENQAVAIDDEIVQLEEQKATLHSEIEALKAQKEQMLLEQVKQVQDSIGQMLEEGTKELQERKMALQIEIEKLERRKERINQEMRNNFAGSSQELAVKVQGFKDYLVGSLQDLVTAAEKLELARVEAPASRRSEEQVRSRENLRRDDRDRGRRRESDERGRARNASVQSSSAQFSEPTFAEQTRVIRQLLDKYRNNPDYYGSPWQLRRTFEAVHEQKVQEWFFVQGGRGAVDTMGSRLQNILVASAIVSVLYNLYSDRFRVLVLTDTPENLGEWRRGLQDCLGISRSNFGSNRGVVLFDSPNVLVQRAERLIADKLLPLIIIDETEELLNLAVLKFPLWLAFASGNKPASPNYLY